MAAVAVGEKVVGIDHFFTKLFFSVTANLFIFSRVLRDSTPRYVGQSVGWSPLYSFSVFEPFEPTAPAQML